ncbi:anthranilate phosphoribosyltransferase [compost metagenome]
MLNAAAALVVADRAADLREGAELAAAVIDDGRAARALETLVRVTNTPIEPEAA